MPLPPSCKAYHSHTYLCEIEGCGRIFQNRSGLTKHFNTFHLTSPSPPGSPNHSSESIRTSTAGSQLPQDNDIFQDFQEAIHDMGLENNIPEASTNDSDGYSEYLFTDRHPLINGRYTYYLSVYFLYISLNQSCRNSM